MPFNLFSRDKRPDESAPPAPEFVDIHLHVLPQVDDGPVSFEETLRLLRRIHSEGVRELVATPHMFLEPYNNVDPLPVYDRFARTLGALKRAGREPKNAFLRDLRVYLGAENYVSPEFLLALENRTILTLNGGRYLLFEFSPFLPLSQLELSVRRVLEHKLVPVIAHAERVSLFQKKPQHLHKLVEMGCLIQVNGASIVGTNGRRSRRTALALLRKGLVHVIASDGHSARYRPPELKGAYFVLQKEFPHERLKDWFRANPLKMLRNEPLAGPP